MDSKSGAVTSSRLAGMLLWPPPEIEGDALLMLDALPKVSVSKSKQTRMDVIRSRFRGPSAWMRRCGIPGLIFCVCFTIVCLVLQQFQLDHPKGLNQGFLRRISLLNFNHESDEILSAIRYFEQQDSCPLAGRNMTIVSGYINIGSFRKGLGKQFDVETYRKWAAALQSIENPVVLFTDDRDTARLLVNYRNRSEHNRRCTRIHLISRSDLWGFQLRSRIGTILKQSSTRRPWYPNTIMPDYGCVMHSKYDMLQIALRKDVFATKYYAWMDVGLFRDEKEWNGRTIRLLPPPQHDSQRVAFNQVANFQRNITPAFVFSENQVYVGGGIFLGTRNVMLAWSAQYKKYTEHFIKMGLTNSDQQVIYSMFTTDALNLQSDISLKRQVQIQTFAYIYDGDRDENWLSLRNLCRDTGERQIAASRIIDSSSSDRPQSLNSFGTTQQMKPVEHDKTVCDSELTVVTSFFSFGSFAVDVDGSWKVVDQAAYQIMATGASRMRNTLVVFSDSEAMLDTFRNARVNLTNCTFTILLSPDELWSWGLLPTFYKLHAQRSANANSKRWQLSNFALPEFYAVQHSKIALVANASMLNPFNSTYFAWSDIGVIHAMSVNKQNFVFKKFRRHSVSKPGSASSLTPESRRLRELSSLVIDVGGVRRDNKSQGVAGNSECDQPYELSTKYMAGHKIAFQAFEKTYRRQLEAMLNVSYLPSDDEVLKATLCRNDSTNTNEITQNSAISENNSDANTNTTTTTTTDNNKSITNTSNDTNEINTTNINTNTNKETTNVTGTNTTNTNNNNNNNNNDTSTTNTNTNTDKDTNINKETTNDTGTTNNNNNNDSNDANTTNTNTNTDKDTNINKETTSDTGTKIISTNNNDTNDTSANTNANTSNITNDINTKINTDTGINTRAATSITNAKNSTPSTTNIDTSVIVTATNIMRAKINVTSTDYDNGTINTETNITTKDGNFGNASIYQIMPNSNITDNRSTGKSEMFNLNKIDSKNDNAVNDNQDDSYYLLQFVSSDNLFIRIRSVVSGEERDASNNSWKLAFANASTTYLDSTFTNATEAK